MSIAQAAESFLKHKNTGANCAFGYEHPKQGFIGGENTACHAGFRMPRNCTAFYSSLFPSYTVRKKVSKAWFKYVLGPYSPWRTAIKNLEIIYDKGEPIAFKNDGDVPLFTAFSLCLACRMENGNNIEAWYRLHEAGFGRIEALYLSSFISYCNGTWVYQPWSNHGYPFAPKKLSYKKLVGKVPNPSEHTFDSGEKGIYCNGIWSNKDNTVIQDATPAILQTKPIYKGLFSGFAKPYENDKKNAIKQGKELFKALREWKEEWGKT